MLGSVAFGTAPLGGLPPVADGGTATITFTSSGTCTTSFEGPVRCSGWDIPHVPIVIMNLWLAYFGAAEVALWKTFPGTPMSDSMLAVMLATLASVIAERE